MSLFALKLKRSVKPDSRVRVLTRWRLAVSMGRKVCGALGDSEVIGQQTVENVARLVREAKVMMARDSNKAGKGTGVKLQAREALEGYCDLTAHLGTL